MFINHLRYKINELARSSTRVRIWQPPGACSSNGSQGPGAQQRMGLGSALDIIRALQDQIAKNRGPSPTIIDVTIPECLDRYRVYEPHLRGSLVGCAFGASCWRRLCD